MKALLEKIASMRFLVVGDLMLDHYLWGDATRISPEAPVPVVKTERDTFSAGGAANVAANLRALGAAVELVGTIGADENGRRLQEVLAASAVAFDAALASPARPTILKQRVMCRNQQLCRIDREAAPAAYALPEDWLDASLAAKIASADAVLLSDYAKGVVTPALIRRVQTLAAKAGIPVSLDPKPRAGLDFSGLDIITPNRAEAFQLAGMTPPSAGEPFPAEALCGALDAKFATKLLVVTLGEGGMLLSTGGKPLARIPTAARAVFDVSGAGDTVNAVLTAAIAAGAAPETAAALANQAAGVVVEKLGTATASPAEILAHASPLP
jgi:D-beta-D-heptose 7-phosphate kinase/D-beta-D-heptose 1-phosphate adenosyltransferase